MTIVAFASFKQRMVEYFYLLVESLTIYMSMAWSIQPCKIPTDYVRRVLIICFFFFLIFSSLHCLCFHLNIISLLLVATFDIICRQTHVDLMLEFVVFSFPKRAGLYLRVSCHDMFVPTRRVMCKGGGEGDVIRTQSQLEYFIQNVLYFIMWLCTCWVSLHAGHRTQTGAEGCGSQVTWVVEEFHWNGGQLWHTKVWPRSRQFVSPFSKPALWPPGRWGATHTQHKDDDVAHVEDLLHSFHF